MFWLGFLVGMWAGCILGLLLLFVINLSNFDDDVY